MLIDAVDKQLEKDGAKITTAHKSFPMKKTMYYNIKCYLKGTLGYEGKLYTNTKLEEVLSDFGVCEKLTPQTFFSIS